MLNTEKQQCKSSQASHQKLWRPEDNRRSITAWRKICQKGILYPAKISFRRKAKVKTFSDGKKKKKLKEVSAIRAELQKMLLKWDFSGWREIIFQSQSKTFIPKIVNDLNTI